MSSIKTVFSGALDDRNTYVALLNGAEMAAGQPGKIGKVMRAASDETFEIVNTVLSKSDIKKI